MIETADFTSSFFGLLAETFGVAETPHGFILDTGQSGLLGTVNTLSAEVASAARSAEDATIAGHCGHVLFLLRLFIAYEEDGQQPHPDWPSSWSTRVVDAAAWETLRGELQAAYTTLVARFQARQTWDRPVVGAALMLLAHCAYHVGEIRQRLIWVQP
jgi:hypothetical protein